MIYFVLPPAAVNDLMMEEAVETDQTRLRTSLDGTLVILSVPGIPTYAFATRRRYSYEDIKYLLSTAAWDEEDD